MNYDFAGWATRNDLRCSDGRTIRRDAFKHNDGETVPLVWNHQHNDPLNVLGHALLENRAEGVYAYCTFNDTESGLSAKELVKHGDVTALSIYANQLKQNGGDVLHGSIREVSIVLAGANPGAFIDTVLSHSDSDEEEAVIFSGENINVYLEHSEEPEKKEEEKPMPQKEETVAEVFESMTEAQKTVCYALIGQALADKEEENMKHNVFENDMEETTLQHADVDEAAIFADAARYGSLKESALAHGITDIEFLFPESHELNREPGFINTNPLGWVETVMNGVSHTPFSRVKMTFANITADEARAKGYIKGNQKIAEVFPLLKREVSPTTVYKKQELDRDDVVDITSFDVVSWLKREMRMKLNEELARAFIFGDGRAFGVSNDAINPQCIIPVVSDTASNLYAMRVVVSAGSGESPEHALVRSMVKAMDAYEGKGDVTLFLPQGTVSDLLLVEDTMGHRLYKNLNELALAMNVERIVKVPASIVPSEVLGVALDLRDYNVGADKGGAVSMFDDFDIDYNKMKYLIETRCSGALTQPHSAIVLVTGEDA